MDLGYTPEPPEAMPTVAEKPKKPETRYPSFDLQDGSVDALKGEHQCAVGDEYYADGVRLRVKSVEDSEYGKRLSFEVLSVEDFEPAEGASKTDEADESMTGDSEKPAKKTPKALRYS